MGEELVGRAEHDLCAVRGTRVAMVFQDPMNTLTPHLRIGRQLTELLTDRGLLGAAEARQRAVAVLHSVGIPDPESASTSTRTNSPAGNASASPSPWR